MTDCFRSLLIATTFAVVTACTSHTPTTSAQPEPPQPKSPGIVEIPATFGRLPPRLASDPDELAVYAAALPDLPELEGKRAIISVVTGDSLGYARDLEKRWREKGTLTIRPGWPIAGMGYSAIPVGPLPDSEPMDLPLALLDDYTAKNALRYVIGGKISPKHLRVEMTVENNEQYASLVGVENGRIISRYSKQDTLGAVRSFSRVGFNADRTLALLSWVDLCAPSLCGHGQIDVFQKREGGWHRLDTISSWAH